MILRGVPGPDRDEQLPDRPRVSDGGEAEALHGLSAADLEALQLRMLEAIREKQTPRSPLSPAPKADDAATLWDNCSAAGEGSLF